MNTTTSYKIKLIDDALKHSIAVRIEVRGRREFLAIKAMKNLNHSVLLTLDKQAGFIAIDPEDIFEVWVPKLPPAFQPEAI